MKTYLKAIQNAILLIVMITSISACGQVEGNSSKDKKERLNMCFRLLCY
ncbi:MAG: hypothetical protein IEMM0008_1612 [bacterium]|nr:MAG: hypothetical protein IEMM0008_1612 [bacterium]